MQLAEVYDPQGALDAGFLDEIVALEQVESHAIERATSWAADLDPKAFAKTRTIARGELLTKLRATTGN